MVTDSQLDDLAALLGPRLERFTEPDAVPPADWSAYNDHHPEIPCADKSILFVHEHNGFYPKSCVTCDLAVALCNGCTFQVECARLGADREYGVWAGRRQGERRADDS